MISMDHKNDGRLNLTHPLDLSARGKIHVSGVSNVFHTTRLCERLVQPKSDFDLTDPNGYLLNSEYNNLHDPNLKSYLQRKDIHQRLISGGFITKDEKVICSVKELNLYRKHLSEVELDWDRIFRTEQKELVRKFLTLQEQGKIPHTVALSDVTEWLLQRGRGFFNKQQQPSRLRFQAPGELQPESSLLRLPSIAARSNMVDQRCCLSSTCRSELVWAAKGRQMLEEVTREVTREMRLERHWARGQQAKEERKKEIHQRRMHLKGKRKQPCKTKADPQYNPSSQENNTSDLDSTQVDMTASTCSSENQPLPPRMEPQSNSKTELSALCQNLVVAVTKRSIVSAHSRRSSDDGLVTSTTQETCSSLIGNVGSLQSITQQLSDIEQRLLEHFKGTITTEELHTIIQDMVVTVVEEVNGILIPAIMAFEYECLMTSCDISTTHTSLSSSNDYRSSVSDSLQSSTPQILTPSATPPVLANATVVREGARTPPRESEMERSLSISPESEASLLIGSDRQASPLIGSESQASPEMCPGHSGSPRGDLLLKVEGLLRDVVKRAVRQLEAEGDNERTSANTSPEEQAAMNSKSDESASRGPHDEMTLTVLDPVADVTAKTDIKKVETIKDMMSKMEAEGVDTSGTVMDQVDIEEIQIIADVMAKTIVREAKTTVDAMSPLKVEEGHKTTDDDVMAKTEERCMETMVDEMGTMYNIESKEAIVDAVVESNIERIETCVDEIGETEAKGEQCIAHVKDRREAMGVESIVDVVARTQIREELTAHVDAKAEETIADVMAEDEDTQEAETGVLDTEAKPTGAFEANATIDEEAKIVVNADETGTAAGRNIGRELLIQTAGEPLTNVIDEYADTDNGDRNTQTEGSSGSEGSTEMFQSDDEEGHSPCRGPWLSLLKSTSLSSHQVDEILDSVIAVLTEEGHEVIFSEERPATTSPGMFAGRPESRPSNEPLCCVSGGQEPHIQRPGEDPDSPCKLLGGYPSYSLSRSQEEVSDGEILPYANSIVNVLMQEIQNGDDSVHEPVGGGKVSLLQRRRLRPAFLKFRHLSASGIPVLHVLKKASDERSLSEANTNNIRVVMWVLQTVQRRHGWLGHTCFSGKQPTESRLLCEVIQILLDKLKQRYAGIISAEDMNVPTLTDALKTNDGNVNHLNSFKVKLQEATVGLISDILKHMSSNIIRPKSCIRADNKWTPSSLRKSVSFTDLSHTLTSAVAIDISSSVIEKLTEALGSSKTTSSMTNLREFVRALSNSNAEHSQQASQEHRINHVYKEVLELVMDKLRSFITQGQSHKPRQRLAETMAESCLEVERAFTEILKTLKGHRKEADASGEQAVDHLSTVLSDTMFKHACEARPSQAKAENIQQDTAAQVTSTLHSRSLVTRSLPQNKLKEPAKKSASQPLSSTTTASTTDAPLQQLHPSSLIATRQKIIKDVFLPKSCERDIATVSGLGMPNLRLDSFTSSSEVTEVTGQTSDLNQRCFLKARMSKASFNLLQMTVEKFACKLLEERKALFGGTSSSPQPGSEESKEPQNTNRDQLMATPCSIGSETLVPTPPPRPSVTKNEKDEPPHEGSLENRRRGRSLRTLQAAKRAPSSMALHAPGTSGRIAHAASSSDSLSDSLSDPFTPPSSSSASSNTSLAASEITEEVMCKLLKEDSPDLRSLTEPQIS